MIASLATMIVAVMRQTVEAALTLSSSSALRNDARRLGGVCDDTFAVDRVFTIVQSIASEPAKMKRRKSCPRYCVVADVDFGVGPDSSESIATSSSPCWPQCLPARSS